MTYHGKKLIHSNTTTATIALEKTIDAVHITFETDLNIDLFDHGTKYYAENMKDSHT